MHLIIVGGGPTTRAVLELLGDRWEIAVVDPDPARLASLADARPVETIQGDGSSAVTLRRARLDRADALLAAADDDEVSLEACRLALSAGVSRVLAVVNRPDRAGEFRAAGATTVTPAQLAARRIEHRLEPRRVTSASFAAGRAEAVEFRIQPDSRLSGRSLRDLDLHRWLVAAVLRGDELVVPRGETTLHPNDLVTVVGPVADYAAMVETFTGGRPHFPLDHGRNVMVPLSRPVADAGTLRTAAWIARVTGAGALVVAHDDAGSMDDRGQQQVLGTLEELAETGDAVEIRPVAVPATDLGSLLRLRDRHGVGLLVVPRPNGRLAAGRAVEAVRRARLPALFVGAEAPIQQIVAPARDSIVGWRATWVAIDLAAQAGLPLEALGVILPEFLADETDRTAIRQAVARIRDEASVQGVEVRGRLDTGNPVRVFRALEPGHLIVLGLPRQPITFVRPGRTGLIVAGARSSVLVVPEPEPLA